MLLTQARAVPYFKQGKSVGLRLFAIKAGSLFEKIGLKNGDKVVAMSGKTTESIYGKKWQSFGDYKDPKAFGPDKYTGFLYDVFAQRYETSSVLLILYRKQGRSWEPKPIGLRVSFNR